MNKMHRGFTLVELIVVIAVLVILAMILIPVVNGYVEDAKAATVVANARTMLSAAKAAAVSEYASNPHYATGATKFVNKATGEKVGRVTNFMLYRIQSKKLTSSNVPADQSVDFAIAYSILENMGSLSSTSAGLQFSSDKWPSNGTTVDAYYQTNKQPGVIVAYTADGDIECLELGMNGYLVHMNGDSTYTITKNGKFTKNYPD